MADKKTSSSTKPEKIEKRLSDAEAISLLKARTAERAKGPRRKKFVKK